MSARDKDILYKINNYLKSDVPIREEVHNMTGNKLVVLHLNSLSLVNNLIQYGLRQGKSMHESFFTKIPNELMKHYIRGIIDGDGYIRKNAIGIGLCGSYSVVSHIREFLNNELNLNFKNCFNPRREGSSDLYRIDFSGKRALAIIKYLYDGAQIYINRKYDLAKRWLEC